MLTLLSTSRHYHQLADLQAVSQSTEWGDSGIGERTARSDAVSPTTSAEFSMMNIQLTEKMPKF